MPSINSKTGEIIYPFQFPLSPISNQISFEYENKMKNDHERNRIKRKLRKLKTEIIKEKCLKFSALFLLSMSLLTSHKRKIVTKKLLDMRLTHIIKKCIIRVHYESKQLDNEEDEEEEEEETTTTTSRPKVFFRTKTTDRMNTLPINKIRTVPLKSKQSGAVQKWSKMTAMSPSLKNKYLNQLSPRELPKRRWKWAIHRVIIMRAVEKTKSFLAVRERDLTYSHVGSALQLLSKIVQEMSRRKSLRKTT
jgi:RNase P protein component